MKTLKGIKWNQILISLILGLALGTTFGQWRMGGDFHKHWKKGDGKQHMMDRFNKELRLSTEQAKQVAAIFETSRSQMLALHNEMRPKFESLRNTTDEQIQKLLNPDQQKKFAEMKAKMEERHKKHGEHFGAGPQPPPMMMEGPPPQPADGLQPPSLGMREGKENQGGRPGHGPKPPSRDWE